MAKKVRIVLADGKHTDATVTREHKSGHVDVEFEHKGAPVVITRCPLDPTGKMPDSYHPISMEAEASPAPAAQAEQKAAPPK